MDARVTVIEPVPQQMALKEPIFGGVQLELLVAVKIGEFCSSKLWGLWNSMGVLQAISYAAADALPQGVLLQLLLLEELLLLPLLLVSF